MYMEDLFDASRFNVENGMKGKKSQLNYRNDEDDALVRAWDKLSLDEVTGNYQTGSNDQQHIKDLVH